MSVPQYGFKPVQATPILNLASKMDARSNNEFLDVTPEQINAQGFVFTNIENADLFNTKALSARLGNINVCDQIIDMNGKPTLILDLLSGVPSGTVGNIKPWSNGYLAATAGTIIIPSGNFNIFNGDLVVGKTNVNAIPIHKYGYRLNAMVYKLNQTNIPASGVGFMSGLYGLSSGIVRDIGYNGNYGGPPSYYPQIEGAAISLQPNNSSNSYTRLQPEAISNNNSNFEFNSYITSSGTIETPNVVVPFEFNAPYLFTSGNVYFIGFSVITNSGIDAGASSDINNLVFKNSVVTGDYQMNTTSALDKNQTYGFNHVANAVVMNNQTGGKGQLMSVYNKYNSADYMLNDKPTSSFMWSAPIISGGTQLSNETTYASIDTTSIVPINNQWDGLNNIPSLPTNQVEFGELVYVPSGLWTLYGGYFLANTFSGLDNSSNSITYPFSALTPTQVPGNSYGSYTRNKAIFPTKNYNVGYAGHISKILTSSGNIDNGTYQIYNRQVLASFSGNHSFTDPYNYSDLSILSGTNAMGYTSSYNGDKLYVVYDNPPLVQSNGEYYLMSFKFYDASSFGDLTDYMSVTSTSPSQTSTNTSFSSPILINMEKNGSYSGTFLYNRSNDGLNFKQINTSANPSLGISGYQLNLTCGLIYLPSGNAITSIYDYRVEGNRSQRTIVTQKDRVLSAPLYFCNWTTILSGAAIDNKYIWSHTTYQNTLISHQYSQSSGVVWDQIYINTSGNSMQQHGHRPAFNLSGVAYTTGTFNPDSFSGVFYPGIASGTPFSVVLATQLGTGGLRASNIVDYTMPFSGVAQIYGSPLRDSDIFNTGVLGTDYTQYNFDVLPQSTYVFVTQPSGSLFYLAGLVNKSGVAMPNPLPNTNSWNLLSGNALYINDLSTTNLQQQIPQIIAYDQQYLTDQIDVPKFKKVGVFKDMPIGVGDPENPSRLWYGQQFTANIFGVDGKYCGYIDIELGNGEPITGFEILKDYLIVFKYNSAYRLAYTGDPANPFQVYQLSNTIGSLGFFSTVSTDYGVFGLSQFGPFLATNVGVETIGDEIVPYFDQLDHTDLTFSVAIHDRLRQQIYWSISPDNDSQYNNIGLIYSYAEKAWNVRVGGMWNAAGIIKDEDGFNLLYTGDNMGQLQQISVGTSNQDELFTDTNGVHLTKNITLVAETPWLNLGNSMNLKQLKNIRVNCASSAQRIRVDVYFDQNDSIKKYTRYLNMSAPVINRLASLAGTCRTVKFVFTSVGNPSPIELNSLQITFQDLGGRNQN